MPDIAGRIDLARLASDKAAVGDIPTWNGQRWTATPPAAAAAPIGYGEATVSWPSSMATGSTIAATGLSIGTLEGDHGLSVSGTNLTYQPGIYVIAATGQIAALSGASSEIHISTLTGPGMGFATAASFGTTRVLLPLHVANRYASAVTGGFSAFFASNAAVPPNFEFVFDTVDVTFLRFANP